MSNQNLFKMKKLLLLGFLPVLSLAQTQIGNDINGEGSFDQSGKRIALSADGSIVAIGAEGNDVNGTSSDAGHVRVYRANNGTWLQVGQDINGEADNDRSGSSVALSSDGTIVAVGAFRNDGQFTGDDKGHVRVFRNTNNTWSQIGQDIDGANRFDFSGRSVSLSADGSVVAIGADGNDANGSNSGHVRIYRNSNGTWTKVGQDINGESAGDQSGTSIDLSSNGNIVAIGAERNDGNGNNSGHVRVYQNINGTWTKIGQDIDGEAETDYCGSSVSLSSDGSIVAIGAILNDGNGFNSGHVRVFENIAGSWNQIGQDIDGETAGEQSGSSVSLSSDGNIVAIGAAANNGNGSNSGHVRIFENVNGTWVKKGQNIVGNSGDRSGVSVSLSDDGNIVAIGADRNGDNGPEAGQVRVFDIANILSSDNFVKANFLIYPNPTADVVTIELDKSLQLDKVNIYTSTGQLVKSDSHSSFSISEFGTGTYFLEVITNKGKATKTVLVK